MTWVSPTRWQSGTYLAYLAMSLVITVTVGQTLHHHGRPFLISVFSGNVPLADALNHLLLAGFYLTNMGLAVLLVPTDTRIEHAIQALEVLSRKTGLVLLILAGMHVNNVLILLAIRRRHEKA